MRLYNVMTTPIEIRVLMQLAEKHFAPLGFDVSLTFERVGQGTFDSKIIGAVSDLRTLTLIVNLDWYENQETPEQDVKYIIWHEMRHMYQRSQILRSINKAPIHVKEEILHKWDYEFRHYIPNTPDTEYEHMNQEIEIDAYAFALYMLFQYSSNADGSIDIGLPPMIEDELMKRVHQRLAFEKITGKLFLG